MGWVLATKPYKFIGFGAMEVTKPYKFIGFGDIHNPKPYKFIGFGCIHGPKSYKFIGFGGILHFFEVAGEQTKAKASKEAVGESLRKLPISLWPCTTNLLFASSLTWTQGQILDFSF